MHLSTLKFPFVALVLALSAVGYAQADAPAKGLAGTTWKGKETLSDPGYLEFRFHGDGTVTMIDDNSTVTGRYRTSGVAVTIEFKNCVYDGIVKDNQLVGTAVFTEGPGRIWSFNVTR